MSTAQAPKWLYQLMGQRTEPATEEDVGIEPASRDDDDYLRMRIKKKQRTHLLRKMLEDGGYGELSKMTNLSMGKSGYAEPPEDSY